MTDREVIGYLYSVLGVVSLAMRRGATGSTRFGANAPTIGEMIDDAMKAARKALAEKEVKP